MNQNSNQPAEEPVANPDGKKPTFLQLVFSIFAAFCGVQNYENHERDNAHIESAGFMPYIIVGVVMTLLILVSLYGLVMLILP